MHKDQSLKKINQMSPQDRWQSARDKLSDAQNVGAASALIEHLRTHENTRWLVYSPELARQVPRSYAGLAF